MQRSAISMLAVCFTAAWCIRWNGACCSAERSAPEHRAESRRRNSSPYSPFAESDRAR